ncbi:DUF4148 domain-containing protein [Burkholderia sp. Ac-20392]|uniref:DUF4148 domain-containing protein n=1 Tax=Burkholderia sp. Ac-20392 TaxID=2703905 RepID=UPI00197DCA7D|nr:DUF4148 domain-containing protein [Burkholderia sp. Ac-20392]MBN3794108.1 DUF4148 domain-containing protein [Burkholderia sp. Ac-20392]
MNKRILNIYFALSALTLSAVASTAIATPSPCTTPPTDCAAQPAIQQSATPEPQHALTRREVIDDLIKAEKDGTIKRLNDTIYHGS